MLKYLLFSISALFISASGVWASSGTAHIWLTTADESQLLAAQPDIALEQKTTANIPVIEVDSTQTFQQMEGFGGSLTESSAWLMATKLNPAQRNALMAELFDPKNGINLDFLRQPIGSSDFAFSDYSLDDMPRGKQDPTLSHFSLARDQRYVIPLLKQALAINPGIKIMLSPWSAPPWMKTNERFIRGSLKQKEFSDYSHYLVKTVEAYETLGLPIYALTVQNEPMGNSYFSSTHMTAKDQADFIEDDLGPDFKQAGIATRILLFDHNWKQVSYPLSILNAYPGLRAYISGTAFHCYNGRPAMVQLLEKGYPDKGIFLTECTSRLNASFALNLKRTAQLLIASARSYAKSVVLWNIALNSHHGPHTKDRSACKRCIGFAVIDASYAGGYKLNADYYAVGQASKFVMPGAYHIGSTNPEKSLMNVAFRNPDGSHVMVVLNKSQEAQIFQVKSNDSSFRYNLPPGALATFKW